MTPRPDEFETTVETITEIIVGTDLDQESVDILIQAKTIIEGVWDDTYEGSYQAYINTLWGVT